MIKNHCSIQKKVKKWNEGTKNRKNKQNKQQNGRNKHTVSVIKLNRNELKH